MKQTEKARQARHNRAVELDFMIMNFMKYHPQAKPSFIIKELSLKKGTFYNFARRNRGKLIINRKLENGQIISFYSVKSGSVSDRY